MYSNRLIYKSQNLNNMLMNQFLLITILGTAQITLLYYRLYYYFHRRIQLCYFCFDEMTEHRNKLLSACILRNLYYILKGLFRIDIQFDSLLAGVHLHLKCGFLKVNTPKLSKTLWINFEIFYFFQMVPPHNDHKLPILGPRDELVSV